MQTLKIIFYGLIAYALFEIFAYEVIHYGDMRQDLGYRVGSEYAREMCRVRHQDLLWEQVSDKDKFEMWYYAERNK